MPEALKIYSDFYKIEPTDYIEIISFYEKNETLLDNKSKFKDKEDFNNFVLLLGQYVISLEEIGKYSKAVKYADKFLHLIDLGVEEFNIDKKDFTTYWSIMTSKGRALYYLKDYKNSISVFEKLLEWDSENDNFRNWLDESKSRRRNSINKYLYVIASILVITDIFLGDKIGNPQTTFYITGSGFIIFIIALINEYFIDKILKIIKK